jgi:hypothetical protein
VYSTAPYEDQLIVRSNSSETGISLRNDITNVTWQLGMEGNPPSMPIGSFFIQNETKSYTPVIITPGGYVGIWDAAPAYQLDVQGYVRGVFISASDIRLKRDIHPLSGDLENSCGCRV